MVVVEKDNTAKKNRKNHDFVQMYRYNMKAYRELILTQPTAAAIFLFLAEHMTQNNAVSCSSKVLEELTGKSRSTVWRSIKVLKEKKFLCALNYDFIIIMLQPMICIFHRLSVNV